MALGGQRYLLLGHQSNHTTGDWTYPGKGIQQVRQKGVKSQWLCGPTRQTPNPMLQTTHMGVSENRGPLYSTLNSRILILRTPTIRHPFFSETPIWHRGNRDRQQKTKSPLPPPNASPPPKRFKAISTESTRSGASCNCRYFLRRAQGLPGPPKCLLIEPLAALNCGYLGYIRG